MTKQEKNISCRVPECDKKFSNVRYMKKHMHQSHGISGKIMPNKSTKSAKKSAKKEKPKKVIKEKPLKMNVKEESTED